MPGLPRRMTHWTSTEIRQALKRAPIACKRAWADVRVGAPEPETHGRVLIVTPRKTGSAPYRNLLRRRARAIIAREWPSLTSVNVMVFFKPCPEKIPFQELHTFLSSCLKKYHS